MSDRNIPTETDLARVREQLGACGLIPTDWAVRMCDEIERLRKELAERNERLLLVYEALTGQHRSTWPAAVGSGT